MSGSAGEGFDLPCLAVEHWLACHANSRNGRRKIKSQSGIDGDIAGVADENAASEVSLSGNNKDQGSCGRLRHE